MLICVGATSKTYRSCGSVLNTVKRYFIVMFVRIFSEDCWLHRAFLFEQKSTQIHRNSMYTVTTLPCVHPLLDCKAVLFFSLPTSERRGCAGGDWSGKQDWRPFSSPARPRISHHSPHPRRSLVGKEKGTALQSNPLLTPQEVRTDVRRLLLRSSVCLDLTRVRYFRI